jgi:hypothetical protein
MDSTSGKEQQLGQQLAQLEAELQSNSGTSFRRRAEALAAAARLRKASIASTHSALAHAKFDAPSMDNLFAVLQQQVAAVQQLQDVLRGNLLDVEVMHNEVEGSNSGAGPLNMTLVRAA